MKGILFNHPPRTHFLLYRFCITLLAISLFAPATLFPAPGDGATPDRQIVILHSYHKGYPWTDGVEEGLRKGLKQLANVQIFTEYLDSRRQSLESAQGPFGRYLRSKYQYRRPDLIIVSDNEALSFLRSQPVETFEDVPVIFCGITDFSEDLLQGPEPAISGIVEKIDPAGTFRLLHQLLPDCQRLIVISDSTPSGLLLREQVKKELAERTPEIPIEWWHGLNRIDLEMRLQLLSPSDGVLLTQFNRSPDNQSYSHQESGRFISATSPAPVFVLYDFYLGSGVAGGRVVSSRAQGKAAAKLAHHFFESGRMVKTVSNSPNVTIFDAAILNKHKLSSRKLPPEAIITGNKADSQYLGTTTTGIAILLGAIIIILAFMLRPLFNMQTNLLLVMKRSVLGITSIFILCLLLILLLSNYFEYQRFTAQRYQQLLTDKKQTLIMMVKQVVKQIEADKGSHLEPTKIVQQKLLQRMDSFSFMEGAGYIFVLDFDGTVLFHHSEPELAGKKMTEYQDINGIHPVWEIIDIAKQQEGAFVSYLRPKPDGEEPVRKLTYTIGIHDWKWAVASTIYLDDIDAILKQEQTGQHRFFIQELFFLLLTSFLLLTILFIISRRLSSQVKKELTSLEKGLDTQNSIDEALAPEQYHIQELAHMATGIRNAFSDLDQANQKLHANEQQFFATMHASPNAMLLINNNSFIACNDAAAHMLGYGSSEQLLNLHPSHISPPIQADGENSVIKAEKILHKVSTQGTSKFEWLHLHKNGTIIPIEVTLTLSPITISRSNTVLQCVWRDLTHEKETARQMREVEQEQQATLEKSERMNRLMSGREKRILKIKEEVNSLLQELHRSPRYGNLQQHPQLKTKNVRTDRDDI